MKGFRFYYLFAYCKMAIVILSVDNHFGGLNHFAGFIPCNHHVNTRSNISKIVKGDFSCVAVDNSLFRDFTADKIENFYFVYIRS